MFKYIRSKETDKSKSKSKSKYLQRKHVGCPERPMWQIL